MIPRPNLSLEGRKGLITGIANESSIAWGCAKAFRSLGADLAVTYLNEKAKPYVEPLAKQLEAAILMPLDLRAEGQLEAVFERSSAEWGRLDFLLHSIAFAPMARTCTAASSTARKRASSPRWKSPAGRSSAWPSSPSP